jgi:flagellar hook-basal body complex protein FliE
LQHQYGYCNTHLHNNLSLTSEQCKNQSEKFQEVLAKSLEELSKQEEKRQEMLARFELECG